MFLRLRSQFSRLLARRAYGAVANNPNSKVWGTRLCGTVTGWKLVFNEPHKANKPVTLESAKMTYEPKRKPPYRVYITFEEEGQHRDFSPHMIQYDRFEDTVELLVHLFLPHDDKDV